jgi:hypothetical protein
MRKWLPLMTVCLGTFMLLIDVTIVNVALPDMVGDLGASFGALHGPSTPTPSRWPHWCPGRARSPTALGTAAPKSLGSRSSRPRR